MKKQIFNSPLKFVFFPLLIVFAFSLQSFKSVSGIQIEKRHYRKGYYIHICHGEKTYPVYTTAISVKQERPEKVQEQKPIQQNTSEKPDRSINEPSRSINNAPVSRAPIPSN